MNKETAPDLEYFRKLLLIRQKELQDITDIGQQAADPVELDQSRVGRLSRMDAMQGQAMSLEAKRRREKELLGISAALKRIEADDYGFCIRCEEKIVSGRLEIDPSVLLCVKCASQEPG